MSSILVPHPEILPGPCPKGRLRCPGRCCFSVFYFLYTNTVDEAINNGTFIATGQIDPLVFIFSTCLILGLGLLFVRFYPYLLKFISLLGRPFWSPSQYMALSTVSCAGGSKERFLMLFLILTFACGLFSANTARAINNNKEDMIY